MLLWKWKSAQVKSLDGLIPLRLKPNDLAMAHKISGSVLPRVHSGPGALVSLSFWEPGRTFWPQGLCTTCSSSSHVATCLCSNVTFSVGLMGIIPFKMQPFPGPGQLVRASSRCTKVVDSISSLSIYKKQTNEHINK